MCHAGHVQLAARNQVFWNIQNPFNSLLWDVPEVKALLQRVRQQLLAKNLQITNHNLFVLLLFSFFAPAWFTGGLQNRVNDAEINHSMQQVAQDDPVCMCLDKCIASKSALVVTRASDRTPASCHA